jgi:hypothetical protein
MAQDRWQLGRRATPVSNGPVADLKITPALSSSSSTCASPRPHVGAGP